MKKLYFLVFVLIGLNYGYSQGTETFDNFPETGSSYADGTFTGNDGSTWTYVQSRGDSEITGHALMLGRDRSPQAEVYSGSISGGIGTLTFNYMQAFSTNVNLNVLVNGNVVGTVTSDGEQGVVKSSGTITVNEAGSFDLKFISVNNSDGQVTIDDITWTAFSTSCGVLLEQESYICNSNNVGDNNDSVTIEIPYTGSDAAITNVTTTSGGTVGGNNPASFADGIITITGLSEGDAWDLALVGGDCGAISASGTVPAAECDPIPNTCFDISNGTEQFELVVITQNSGFTNNGTWENNSGVYSANGYCGGGCVEPVESWLVFGPLDMTGVSDLTLDFDASENFGVTDLVVAYTSAYSGCPSGTSWTTAQTITDSGAISVDLASASGTEVYIGIQYADDGTDGYSGWDLENVALNAFGSCPTLGTRPVSDCAVCDLTLDTENYVCDTNTAGNDNDAVIIEIPYNGVESTLTSVTTTSGGTVGGDDPSSIADGVITITGLSEGDAWDLTLNGGDCDGTTISGTVGSAICDPVTTDLVINEILADPDATDGDANGDGVVDTQDDEFIEIYNVGMSSIDLEGYIIADGASDRHVFPAGTILPANGFITVFAGGTPTGISGISQTASSGAFGFNNGGDTVTLKNASGVEVVSYTYGSEGGNNQSIGRSPDFTGSFVEHSTITGNNGRLFSPGENNDIPLSVNQYNKTSFSVYPNPTNMGYVNITSAKNSTISVAVYDILGKQVINKTLTENTLNVSSLNAGMYILKISQDGASTTKKLVIK
ncbi:lamin tail domain-containing protein [Mangrovimonas spongiae]|uniref:T9SS C-terminal target domain-containing protein n=1 Tax=Mangrovimonas spongiae TaxID=2494697 RepID=A0A428K611_9FLAO|nr:lamin tail domain-containing protein [Mangrovimonas spongiae]RSK41845.1 T9SS C-terminal target domain-containing protein [Mangrovimonas spongiae]